MAARSSGDSAPCSLPIVSPTSIDDRLRVAVISNNDRILAVDKACQTEDKDSPAALEARSLDGKVKFGTSLSELTKSSVKACTHRLDSEERRF